MVATQRAEQARSRESRRRILDAALDILVTEGYAAATTVRIQQEAGVSRGKLLHHFPSRDALLVAAVHHLAEERVRAQRDRTDWPDGPDERIDAAVASMWATYAQPYFWASMELWIAARTHKELRAALPPEEHAIGQLVRTATDNFFGPTLTARPQYTALRELLNTSMRGVALTYAITPRNPATDPHLQQWQALARQQLATD
ncbi:TetR family transcriptional regulator [Mycobacteroides saopaulense]|uniref:TetR family transcriptional regulator n=1 Tax=Mycobacteroides saopaulense TaxID=1578165 RepID=A0A1X0IKR5_9MYCO|nr:TetR/AcrR family transcriptional regulator [Mycobacteroides saopaulense]ORB48095.1 TetR family transcriptional regulator [Mycobacteroides saopaulense]